MVKQNNRQTGNNGETAACELLQREGYQILVRNYQNKWGEIDIVARAPDKTLVFVEVKTMREAGSEAIIPENQMSRTKLAKFKKICQSFVAANPEAVGEGREWRMDLVAIEFGGKERKVVRHYESIY